MLKPFDKGLMATTLRYAYEVRDTKPYFEDIPSLKLPDEMAELAEHEVPFAFLTGFEGDEIESRYAKIPVLRKPFSERRLRAACED